MQGSNSTHTWKVAIIGRLLSGSSRGKLTDRLSDAVIWVCVAPLLAGYALGFSSPALDSLRGAHVLLNDWDVSLFGSLITVGGLLGSFMAGVMLEHLGRRMTLLASLASALLGFLLVACASQMRELAFLSRILSGMSAAFAFSAAPVYISEVAPSELRGTLGTLVQLAVTIGILVVYMLGFWLPYWGLALFASIIALVGVFYVYSCILDTPRWLLGRVRISFGFLSPQLDKWLS